MNNKEQLELIKENLAEIIGEKELDEKILSGNTLKVYWGTSPTGKPHIGYFLPLIKISQLVKAGCEVTILFADLHAYLDSMKSSWELLELRTQYYENIIKQVLLVLGTDLTKIKFIKGTDYQLDSKYTIDVYKFMSKITIDSAQKGGAEVVKQSDNPLLSGLVYPLLQILDEIYLGTDAELGGQDQRKIFMMSRDHIHKIGYKPIIHLMNPMIPSITSKITAENENENQESDIMPENIDKYIEQITKLKSKKLSWDNFLQISSEICTELKDKHSKKTNIQSNKMSSSDSNSKIDFIEEPDSIRKKISKAFAEPTKINNTLFLTLQYIIFPTNKLKNIDKFIINREEKYGGNLEYNNLETIKNDYIQDKLTPQDLKHGITDWFINFLQPVRDFFNSNEMIELTKLAYSN